MKIQPDWKEKALEYQWEKWGYRNPWYAFVMYDECEFDTIISLCKFYKKEELASQIQAIKNSVYNKTEEDVNVFALEKINPWTLKENLRKEFCYRKQAAKKAEINSHLDEVITFTERAEFYASAASSYYYQQQRRKMVEDALWQQHFRDDEVQSIEEGLIKFGSLEKIDTEWQSKRYKELREERECATSAK